jgi:hypothetical protein
MDPTKNKGKSAKSVDGTAWENKEWKVVHGSLVATTTNPGNDNLFKWVAEKLPYESLRDVKKKMTGDAEHLEGVYLAHDSMGVARYGGRGQIFTRLQSHKRNYPKQLLYYSFYVVENKHHEREIETVILRAAGPQMTLNVNKVRAGIEPGNINDYEPGTNFFERQWRKGKKAKPKKGRPPALSPA